jgi:hypothetical protein
MPPGDPAAVLDPDTGGLDWLPVSGAEHAQIGHVELRTGRLAAAVDRFDAAVTGLPPGGKADWMFFRAVALQQAGRVAEARDAWQRFEPPGVVAPDRTRNPAALQAAATGIRPPVADGDVIRPRHRFAAEAFVSLEMVGEGIDFFRREADGARPDGDRLSASVALCQLLLLSGRRAEYTRYVADELIPLAVRILPGAGAAREAVSGSVALTVLPLAVEEFAAAVPEGLIRRVGEKLDAWPHGDDEADFACRLALRTCARRLRDAAMAERAGAAVASHPAKGRWELSAGGEVDLESLLRLRVAFLLQDLLREAFGADLTPRPSR